MRFFSFLISVTTLFINCTGNTGQVDMDSESIAVRANMLPDSSAALQLTGSALAQAYCTACHAFPEPALLDKNTWQKGVLPNMALRLGLNLTGDSPYLNKRQQEVIDLLQAGIFPDKQHIGEREWKKIEAYYLQNAPALLEQPVVRPTTDLDNFTAIIPGVNKGRLAYTTLVNHIPATQALWVGDSRNWLFKLNASYQVTDSVKVPYPPVAIMQGADQQYKVLAVGSLNPSDVANGKLLQFPGKKGENPIAVLEGLRRPVDMVEADLNEDGLADLVVCNYGNNLGALTWYKNMGQGNYQAIILKNLPGARKAVVTDFDLDGKPDIMALFAQGTEAIKVFINKGTGKFEEQTLLQFPPVYGLSYFELVDFNKDGYHDILLSNGDNADYSITLKPYHGIRVFLNDGKNSFNENFFYPMHGASKAIARDFDQDGDLDIAAISFFPDFSNPSETGFIYLQQENVLSFKAKTFRKAHLGHWLSMDAGDFDLDGDTDLILGSFTYTPAPAAQQSLWFKEGPAAIILQNNKINANPAASARIGSE